MLILGTLLLATFLASFSDWLFMDILAHRDYAADPGTWRPSGGSRRIVLSQIIGTLASAATILLCLVIPGRPLLVAGAVFAAGPLPVLLQNLQWIRMSAQIPALHAAAWLARLLLATELAAAAAVIPG